ncbi:MAG TPA: carbon-nitrogen family hydrolase, partial [Aminivibrio sp.]|nr:carbon-nitrogen family hydrolase [Aminivibrio sp.]
MKLRVGVLQLDVALGDRERNRKNVEKWMASVSVPSDMPTAVVIPEIWDVGYALDRAAELADPEGRGAAEFLGGLARKY